MPDDRLIRLGHSPDPDDAFMFYALAEATIDPGESTVRHHHRVSEEIYFITAGTGEMEIDGERSVVGVGDAILIPPGAWHQITAVDDTPLRLLCACAPPWTAEDTHFA